MKRHLIGIFLFTAIVAASTALLSIGTSKNPQKTKHFTHLETVVSLDESKEKPPKDDFIPEFFDLPNFDEIDNYQERQNYKIKLISVKEFFLSKYSAPIFNKSELIIKGTENWLAYIENDGKTFLKTTKIKTKHEPEIERIIDEPQYRLIHDQPQTPVFLIKGSKHIKQGKVTSLFNSYSSDVEHENLSLGYKRVFNLNGNEYVLRVASGLRKDGTKVNVLILENNGTQQIVTFNDYYNDRNALYDTIGDLLWVGDLDNDNKLDLYISDFKFEKGGFGGSLYLSTEADSGKLVKEAAYFEGGGC